MKCSSADPEIIFVVLQVNWQIQEKVKPLNFLTKQFTVQYCEEIKQIEEGKVKVNGHWLYQTNVRFNAEN